MQSAKNPAIPESIARKYRQKNLGQKNKILGNLHAFFQATIFLPFDFFAFSLGCGRGPRWVSSVPTLLTQIYNLRGTRRHGWFVLREQHTKKSSTDFADFHRL